MLWLIFSSPLVIKEVLRMPLNIIQQTFLIKGAQYRIRSISITSTQLSAESVIYAWRIFKGRECPHTQCYTIRHSWRFHKGGFLLCLHMQHFLTMQMQMGRGNYQLWRALRMTVCREVQLSHDSMPAHVCATVFVESITGAIVVEYKQFDTDRPHFGLTPM